MAREDEVPLDQLTHKHELMPYDPDDPEWTQVVSIGHAGGTLEVILPRLFGEARVGEVVASAVDGGVAFLLCRLDRPLDEFSGTPGLVVVAVPHRDRRYRAAIAHGTFSLDGDGQTASLGLYPPPGPAPWADQPEGPPGAAPSVLDALRAFHRARPFRPFLIRTTSGERFPVRRPEEVALSAEAGMLVLIAGPGGRELMDIDHIAEVTEWTEGPMEDRDEARADSRVMLERVGEVEAVVRRGERALREEILRVEIELRREIQRGDLELRGGLDLDGLRMHLGLLAWLLVPLLVLILGPGLWWAGTTDSRVGRHELQLERLEGATPPTAPRPTPPR